MSSIKHGRRRLFLFSWHATQKEATTPANETRLGMDLPRRAPQRWPKSMALSAHTGSWRVATVFYARWREPPVWVWRGRARQLASDSKHPPRTVHGRHFLWPQRSPRSHEPSRGWQRQRRGKRGLGIFLIRIQHKSTYSIRSPGFLEAF